MHRTSALQALAIQGRFGADKGAPGVTLSVVHPLSIAMVIARNGKSKALREALGLSTPSAVIPAKAGTQLSNIRSAEKLDSRLPGNDGSVVLWSGPDQYYVQSTTKSEAALYTELKTKLSNIASVTDQSHGRVTIRISGPKARALLAKGTPIVLHDDEFPLGKSALTQMAHVGVHLTRTGKDEFTLSVFRGFSESFWEWLTSQAAEFGYQVS
jgi:methylglutamate dehydrogenase subunit D